MDGTAFGGLTGFFGGSKNNSGLGILGSYEVGRKVVVGFDTKFQILNVYFSATYRLGRSMFIVSQGFTNVIVSIEEVRASRSGSATAISHVFNTGSRFVFFGQARIQGRGLTLSAGVGF